MYQITLDNEFIFGTGVYARPSYDIISPKLLLEVNTAGSFTFTVYPKHPHYNSITELTSYVEITMKGNVLFRGRVISIQRGFYNEKYVVCEGCLAYLMDTIQRPYDFMSGDNHTTPEELFRFFIDRHNGLVDKKRRFIIGDITVTDPNDYIVRADSTYLNTWDSVCQKLIEGFGGILQVRYETDGNYIDYLTSSSDISSQTIEFGKNLIDIKQTENADEIATVIVPVGMEMGESRATISILPDEETDDLCKKGDKVYSKKGIEKYGYIEKSIIYDDIAFPTYLVRNAKSLLISSLNISESVELSAADLSAVNVGMESFRLGGLVKVKSKPHDIERQFVVNRLEIDLMNPKSNRLTLGSMSDSITSQISGVSGSFSYSGGGGQLYQAGTGLELFGSTFNHKNSIVAGSVGNYADKILGWSESFQVPSITYDSEGHIKSVRTRLFQLPPDPQRIYTSGDGIEIAGDVISLTDVITGGTVGQTTAVAPAFGEGFPIPWIKFNDKGQIIGSGNRTVVLPTLDTEMSDTSVNAVENNTVKEYIDAKYNTNRTDITALKATDKSMQTDMLNMSKTVAANTTTANTAKAKAEDALTKIGSGNAAGSATPGGAALSAEKLTKSAGSPTVPAYIDSDGIPRVCMFTLGSMAAKDAGDYATKNHTHNYAGSSSAGGSAASADKLKTARTINGVSFDGTENVTIPRSIKPIARVDGTAGTSGYFKIAHINITGNYANTPILLSYIQRSGKEATLYTCFNSVANVDPTLAGFRGRSIRNQNIDAYIHKSAPSTWDIYVKKVEAYDVLFVTDCRIRNDGTLINFDNTQVSTLPEGCVKAVSEIYLPSSGGTITNGEYAEQLKINRTTSLTTNVMAMIEYLVNGVRKGLLGFDSGGELCIRNADNADMIHVSPDGKITSAAGGKLLYDGSILSTGGEVSISGLSGYSVVLINLSGAASTGFKYGASAVIPISYLSKSTANKYRIYGGIPSSSYITSSGPQAAKNMGGYISASMPNNNTLELTMDSSGTSIGNVQIYSVF